MMKRNYYVDKLIMNKNILYIQTHFALSAEESERVSEHVLGLRILVTLGKKIKAFISCFMSVKALFQTATDKPFILP